MLGFERLRNREKGTLIADPRIHEEEWAESLSPNDAVDYPPHAPKVALGVPESSRGEYRHLVRGIAGGSIDFRTYHPAAAHGESVRWRAGYGGRE